VSYQMAGKVSKSLSFITGFSLLAAPFAQAVVQTPVPVVVSLPASPTRVQTGILAVNAVLAALNTGSTLAQVQTAAAQQLLGNLNAPNILSPNGGTVTLAQALILVNIAAAQAGVAGGVTVSVPLPPQPGRPGVVFTQQFTPFTPQQTAILAQMAAAGAAAIPPVIVQTPPVVTPTPTPAPVTPTPTPVTPTPTPVTPAPVTPTPPVVVIPTPVPPVVGQNPAPVVPVPGNGRGKGNRQPNPVTPPVNAGGHGGKGNQNVAQQPQSGGPGYAIPGEVAVTKMKDQPDADGAGTEMDERHGLGNDKMDRNIADDKSERILADDRDVRDNARDQDQRGGPGSGMGGSNGNGSNSGGPGPNGGGSNSGGPGPNGGGGSNGDGHGGGSNSGGPGPNGGGGHGGH
jgi:uncharacterized membrane protein YgcG